MLRIVRFIGGGFATLEEVDQMVVAPDGKTAAAHTKDGTWNQIDVAQYEKSDLGALVTEVASKTKDKPLTPSAQQKVVAIPGPDAQPGLHVEKK